MVILFLTVCERESPSHEGTQSKFRCEFVIRSFGQGGHVECMRQIETLLKPCVAHGEVPKCLESDIVHMVHAANPRADVLWMNVTSV